MHGPSTQNVNMQVVNSLPAIDPGINHGAIAVREANLLSYPFHDEEQVPHEGMILGFGIGQTGDRLLGNYQNMDGGLGGNIPKGHTEIVLIDNIGGDFFANNLAKKGIVGGCHRAPKVQVEFPQVILGDERPVLAFRPQFLKLSSRHANCAIARGHPQAGPPK
jgi:hypothetical protein